MPTIDPSLYLKNQTTTRVPSNELGKDDFLKILMTQLQNQDPTSPLEDRDFIAQLAQFTSLEQMTNMTNSINKLANFQQMNSIIEYSHLIDKVVSYQSLDENGDNLTMKESKVTSVSQFNGELFLELANGEKISTILIGEVRASESLQEQQSDDEVIEV
ncbi:hypothetical protein GCM10008025_03740 [Ornithinibacillus halotolerans]|uniref:Flagellar hook assembly protein FlgD n=1 Tax=Ornithinibacillus halotolerans TaxID=1274357 RepID=A0A916RP69_9BACI|nr:hypothetical protein GCM10008025_03740 [Ornithinibacillus halotolerans]